MKKFRFRYQTVLKARQDREEQVKNELAQLFVTLQRIEEDITQIKKQRAMYLRHIQNKLSDGAKGLNDITVGKQYYQQMLCRLSRAYEEQQQLILRKQETLAESMKERKIMEKLKERDHRQYLEEINKSEVKAIEEIVNYKNSRRT